MSVGYLLHWGARLSARVIEKEIAHLGVSAGQLPVFFALGDGGSMSTTELARVAGIEQPTMTRTLARMEKLGLVRRQRHLTDARSRLFSLSDTARKKAEVIEKIIARTNASIMDILPESERDSFLTELRAVVLGLERLAAPAEADNAPARR